MNRRSILMLTGLALLGLAFDAMPQAGFAQTDPFLGLWQLNLTKSKFSPAPPPRSQTVTIQGEGRDWNITVAGIDAAGAPIGDAFSQAFDGMSHPLTGTPNPNFDALAATRVDAYTVIVSRTKAGKFVGTQTIAVSPDGKTLTSTTTGVDASGRGVNVIAMYDKE